MIQQFNKLKTNKININNKIFQIKIIILMLMIENIRVCILSKMLQIKINKKINLKIKQQIFINKYNKYKNNVQNYK